MSATEPVPAVSVLITARDAAPYVGEAIDSVLGQTFADLELVIVDDGSQDETVARVAGRAAADRRIRLFPRRHAGIAAAANFGLGMCRSDLVARLDADDRAVPERLARQIAFMAAHPSVAVLGGASIPFYDDGRREPATTPSTSPAEVRRELPFGNIIRHSAVMMRRPVVLALGGYREFFPVSLDYDLWLRVLDRWDIANLPDVLCFYRRHPGQVSSRSEQRQTAYAELARLAFFRRRAGRPDPLDGLVSLDRAALLALGLPRYRLNRLQALLANRWRPAPWPVEPVRGWASRLKRRIRRWSL